MKRTFLFFCLTLFVWHLPAVSQEAAHQASPASQQPAASSHESKGHGEGHGSDNSTLWKIINFAILAGVLGYMIGKNAPAFFQGRNDQIRKGLDDAARISAEANARTTEISRKLAQLQAEIDLLRRSSKAELEADQQRARAETERLLEKVNQHAAQDIEAAGKAARQQLKAYAADLSVNLAEQQIRARMNAQAEDALLAGFVDDLRNRPRAGVQ